MGSKSVPKSKKKIKRTSVSKKNASHTIASREREDGSDLQQVGDSALVHVTEDLLGDKTLRHETIRSIFLEAKKGSAKHIKLLPQLTRTVAAPQVAEAITNLCAILDQPEFASKRSSATFLPSIRDNGFFALTALGEIPEPMLAISAQSKVLRQNWSIIFNAIRYFYRELYSPSISLEDPEDVLKLTRLVGWTVPAIVASIVMDEAALHQMIAKDDTLLNILVRIWLTPDTVFIPNATGAFRNRHRCYSAMTASFSALQAEDPCWARVAKMVHGILREVKWDSIKKIEMLVQYSWDPAKASKEAFPSAMVSLMFVGCLIGGRSVDEPDNINKFMDKLIKDGALPLVFRWFTFIAEDLEKYAPRRSLSEEKCAAMFHRTCGLVRSIMCSRYGKRWTVFLLDQGLLLAIARILPYTQWRSTESEDHLAVIFDDLFPKYFSHQSVVASALKAVKDITANGDITRFETSTLQKPWTAFTDVLLERLVVYTACNRDCLTEPVCKKCVYCSKTEDEATLFKCAGCEDALYCSTECQKMSWKLEHRYQCESSKDLKSRTGTRIPTDDFAHTVGMIEFRRHRPGFSHLLRTPTNPLGIPLSDVFVSVILKETPSIEVRSRRTLPKEHIYHTPEDSGDQGSVFEVLTFSGGQSNLFTGSVQRMDPHFQWFSLEGAFDGDAKAESTLPSRKAAQDIDGKNLPYVLDEIDRHLIDARTHFRPPKPGDEVSPKTIYDYIEEKVAADPNMLAWMSKERSASSKAQSI